MKADGYIQKLIRSEQTFDDSEEPAELLPVEDPEETGGGEQVAQANMLNATKHKERAYIKKRERLSGVLFETALPNEYLVEIGRRVVRPVLGGRRFRLFKKFLRVPGTVETLYFTTDNANLNYQGIGVDGYASWRIDPEHPEVAISTLDFFDEDNPMKDTNNKLKTICMEAVRHVIANMTIDDALKKKDEIGENLKQQLRKFEDRWGILFDQVGIEKVRIMSEKLFEDLQSEFRDELRLNVARTRIQTDSQIAGEENTTHERTETERMDTERKLKVLESENQATIKRNELEKGQEVSEQERLINEARFRKDADFKREQQETDYRTQMEEQQLQTELQELQQRVLTSELEIQSLRSQIAEQKLGPERTKRLIDQLHTSEQLSHELIESLPRIYEALSIDNYSILNTGSDGAISPIGRIMQEVIGLLRANNLEGMLRGASTDESQAPGEPNGEQRAEQ